MRLIYVNVEAAEDDEDVDVDANEIPGRRGEEAILKAPRTGSNGRATDPPFWITKCL